MSKYIDADKLIAEIERLLKCTELHRGEAVTDGSRQTLYWIKDFITSLQQEQPKVDLEKTVEFYCINKKVKMTIQELINYYIDTECAETAIECGF